MRRWSRLRAWWLLVIATAAGAAVAGLTRSLPATAGVALIAAVTAVTGVLSRRGTEALDDDRRSALDMRDKLLRDRRGRLPRVRDITDPVAVGVHRTAAASGEPALPAFVHRDQGDELEAALGAYPFVVIVGESTAGKSRLALEAVRARLPEHRFVLPDPDDRTSMLAARRAVAGREPCVVWLDDLERYLGAGGLTPHVLRQIAADNAGAVVVATIRAKARARFAAPDDGADPGRYHGRDVFELAKEIRLDRRWSPAEIRRARASTDERILTALESAGRFGIGEYLAAGPRLLAMAVHAWDPEGGHTRGAALVAAAVDARRAGWHGPLPSALLERLHSHYLSSRGGVLLRPEPWESALAWATTPVLAVSSLLVPDESRSGHYRVFDYLVDAEDSGPSALPVPEETWEILLADADAATCLDIGREADLRGRDDIARRAFGRALDGGVLLAAVPLADLIARSRAWGDVRQAADLLRTTLAGARDGTGQAELLELRGALSWWTGASGNAEEALGSAREVWEEYRRSYGTDHEITLDAGLNVARWTGNTGDPGEAFRLSSDIRDKLARILGPDHPITMAARFEVAAWADHDGDTGLAIRLWRELDADAVRLFGEHDTRTNDIRWNLSGMLILDGDASGGIPLLESVVAGRAAIYGHEHPRTLAGRLQLAGETGRAGRRAVALAAAQDLTHDAERILGGDHEITFYARYQVALWTAETDRAELFTGLLADSTRVMGPDHPVTERLRWSPDQGFDEYPLPASW
jgi:hypothetical protein